MPASASTATHSLTEAGKGARRAPRARKEGGDREGQNVGASRRELVSHLHQVALRVRLPFFLFLSLSLSRFFRSRYSDSYKDDDTGLRKYFWLSIQMMILI
jgi:hypothetical protein